MQSYQHICSYHLHWDKRCQEIVEVAVNEVSQINPTTGVEIIAHVSNLSLVADQFAYRLKKRFITSTILTSC
jgi:hypothetical protein